MRILVTGGSGYIGSVLVPILLERGHEVTVIDNLLYRQASLLDVCHRPSFKFVRGDVRNKSLIEAHAKLYDVIIPLAAIVGAPACDRDKNLALEVNQTAIKTLSECTSKSQLILFPVTNSGYGIGQPGIYCDENTPLNPISLYGKSKVAAEKILLENGNAITFRLATVFGASPRMRMDLLVNDLVYRAYTDRSVILFDSHFKRNYIHIRDVAEAFLFGLENAERMRGQAYNLGLSEANLSKMELCERIKTHLPKFEILESPIGEDPDKRNYIVSNEKIESLGWKPQFSLDMGIEELLKVYSMLSVRQFANI